MSTMYIEKRKYLSSGILQHLEEEKSAKTKGVAKSSRKKTTQRSGGGEGPRNHIKIEGTRSTGQILLEGQVR